MQDTFFSDDDHRKYLSILKTQSEKFGMTSWGYCLMGNHLHLIATPILADSFAKAVGKTSLIDTQDVNKSHGRSGHIWQNRFYSYALDNRHFLLALASVECNPVRTGLIEKAVDHPCSSATAHLGASDAGELIDPHARAEIPQSKEWAEWLTRSEESMEVKPFRLSTHCRRPWGSDDFNEKLERQCGKWLHPLFQERPRKQGKSGKRP